MIYINDFDEIPSNKSEHKNRRNKEIYYGLQNREYDKKEIDVD